MWCMMSRSRNYTRAQKEKYRERIRQKIRDTWHDLDEKFIERMVRHLEKNRAFCSCPWCQNLDDEEHHNKTRSKRIVSLDDEVK